MIIKTLPKIKNFLQKILIITVGLTVGIIISELIAGVYVKKAKLNEKIKYIENASVNKSQSLIGCRDEKIGWGLKPNSESRDITSDFDVVYSINSNGIRDKEISFEKLPGEFRIIVLGESNVFGWGVDYGKRFSEIIEQILDNTEVINMGVGGFGMDQSLLQLERDGFRFNPDLVILFLFDDFIERCKDVIRDWGEFKPRFVLNEEKKELVLQDLDFVKKKFRKQRDALKLDNHTTKGQVFGKSKSLALLNYNLSYNKIQNRQKERCVETWNDIFNKLSIINKERENYEKKDFNKLVFSLLKKYKELCNKHSAHFLVVKFGKLNFIDNAFQVLDIPCLDLSDVLNKASRFRSLRFNVDPHFNEFPHCVIAEYIAEYISERYKIGKNKDSTYQYLGKF